MQIIEAVRDDSAEFHVLKDHFIYVMDAGSTDKLVSFCPTDLRK